MKFSLLLVVFSDLLTIFLSYFPDFTDFPDFRKMRETIKYQYSLGYSLASFFVMLVLMLLLLTNVLHSNSIAEWLIYGVFAVVFIFISSLLIVKRIVPAIQGKPALELNESCLIDYLRNITIDWKDVKEISLLRNRSSATIRVYLKWVSDYGSEIDIPLRFVKGKDDDIYNKVSEYLNETGVV